MQPRSSLVRWGLWTLPVSGVAFIAGYLINGALPDPAAGAAACMTAFGAPAFAWGALVNLAGMLLNPFGFFALFADIGARAPSRAATGAMIASVLGVAMVLAGYGVIAFDLPLLGRLARQGLAPAELGLVVATSPLLVGFMLLAGLAYSLGSLLFAVALWRGRLSPGWVAVALTLSALLLCFGPPLPGPALWPGLLGAALLAVSGGWIARHECQMHGD